MAVINQDILIIGGGASGLAAAITAARSAPEKSITILEKKEITGKKIISSGNGRCNLSNTACENCSEILDFFAGLGVMTRTDSDGRVYPYTEDSATVSDALLREAERLGVKVITSSPAASVEKKGGSFHVMAGKDKYISEKVLIACGGKSYPKLGSSGDGFAFAKKLGHHVERPVPVLTSIELKDGPQNAAGVRAKGKASLLFRGKNLADETGEIQFNKGGISGICIMNLSRFMMIPEGCTLKDGFDDYEIVIDFFPDMEKTDLKNIIKTRQEVQGFGKGNLADFMLKKPLADIINRQSGGSAEKAADLMKAFTLHPCGARGWDYAQVTRGGVPFVEINMNTMESKITKGLYFAGEVTDFDGPCGGFNLQYAWESGIKAGKGMTEHE